ncbi:MAG: FAD-dependent oxidoreductase [Spirochaetia bacterium]
MRLGTCTGPRRVTKLLRALSPRRFQSVPYMNRDTRTAVIGGGITGITAALRLAQAGHSVDLFEARDHLGGLSDTYSWDGGTWDRFYRAPGRRRSPAPRSRIRRGTSRRQASGPPDRRGRQMSHLYKKRKGFIKTG